MTPAMGGQLQQLMAKQAIPPAEAPNPILTEADVADGPIPPATKRSSPPTDNSTSPSTPSSGQPRNSNAQILLSSLAIIMVSFLMY